MALTFTKKARFNYLSEFAARLERKGEYKEAAEIWNKAGKDASKETNKQWCKYRSNFCTRMAINPFNNTADE